jgi:hypothetical protein
MADIVVLNDECRELARRRGNIRWGFIVLKCVAYNRNIFRSLESSSISKRDDTGHALKADSAGARTRLLVTFTLDTDGLPYDGKGALPGTRFQGGQECVGGPSLQLGRTRQTAWTKSVLYPYPVNNAFPSSHGMAGNSMASGTKVEISSIKAVV